jgi:hypothetical protein
VVEPTTLVVETVVPTTPVVEPTAPMVETAIPTASVVEPTAPMVETTIPTVKVTNVAGFLTARRGQAPPPSMLREEKVAAFLVNEPILAVPANAVGLVEEPLRVPKGPIPSMLDRPLGSKIQHILKDLEMGSEESIGMADDNLGPCTADVAQAPRKPLSTILEIGASS